MQYTIWPHSVVEHTLEEDTILLEAKIQSYSYSEHTADSTAKRTMAQTRTMPLTSAVFCPSFSMQRGVFVVGRSPALMIYREMKICELSSASRCYAFDDSALYVCCFMFNESKGEPFTRCMFIICFPGVHLFVDVQINRHHSHTFTCKHLRI